MRSHLRHSIALREPFRTVLSSAFSWSAYWASHLYNESDLAVRYSSRDGFYLVDSLGGDSAEVLTETYKGSSSVYCYGDITRSDELFFDGDDHTLYFKAKQLQASVVISGYDSILYQAGNTTRGIFIAEDNHKLTVIAGTGVGQQFTTDVITYVNQYLLPCEYFQVYLTINITTKLLNFHIYDENDVEIGTGITDYDISGWTFNSNQNSTRLQFAGRNHAISSCKKFIGVKSLPQCKDDSYVTGLQYHYPTLIDWTDVSGNGNHLSAAKDNPDIVYTKMSSWKLDYGYDKYRTNEKWHVYESLIGADHDVPVDASGNSIDMVYLNYGHKKMKSVAGNLTGLNLARCRIRFTNAFFDRSNTTIWSDKARGGYYDVTDPNVIKGSVIYEGFYDKDDTYSFHINELNQRTINEMLNEEYRGYFFIKCNSNSIEDGHSWGSKDDIVEIFLYTNKVVGANQRKVYQYTGDLFAEAVDDDGNTVYDASDNVVLGYLKTIKPMLLWRIDDGLLGEIDWFPIFDSYSVKVVLTLNVGTDPDHNLWIVPWDTIAGWAANGHEITAHGMSDDDISSYTEAQLRQVLQDCKDYILLRLGIVVRHFTAHKYGGGNAQVKFLARELGYLTNHVGYNIPRDRGPQMVNFPDIDLFDFASIALDHGDPDAYELDEDAALILLKQQVDTAKSWGSLLALFMHNHSVGDKEDHAVELIEYALSQGLTFVTTDQLLENCKYKVGNNFHMRFIVIQIKDSLNQVQIDYNIDSEATVYIDWGVLDSPPIQPVMLTADGTDKSILSTYVNIDSSTYARYIVHVFGNIDKIRKFVINESTVNITKGETDKLTGVSTLTLTGCNYYGIVPTAPSSLIATLIANGIKLDWTDNSTNETGFEIWLSINGANSFLLKTVDAGVVTFSDMRFLTDSLVYKVRAINGVAASAFSNTQTITGTKLITNGGYSGSTDWVDSNEDGVADGFTVGGTGSGSIITGNGFIGRAQRLSGTSNTAVLLHDTLVLTSGKTYYFELKHRSDVEFRMYTWNLNEVIKVLAINTSQVPTNTKFYYAIVTGSNFRFRLMAAGYAELDDFQVREITIT